MIGRPGGARSTLGLSVMTGLLFGMVGTADQRAGFDVAEAHGKAFLFELAEFVGMVEACDRQMDFRGLKILADGHDVAADGAEIAHDVAGLVDGFSHADDET